MAISYSLPPSEIHRKSYRDIMTERQSERDIERENDFIIIDIYFLTYEIVF